MCKKIAGLLLLTVWAVSAHAAWTDNELDRGLMTAIFTKNLSQVQYYFNQGANLNTTVLPLTPLAMAVQRGASDIAAFLLENGANVDTPFLPAPDTTPVTPLLYAFQHGDLATAEILLQHHADPSDSLWDAVSNNREQDVALLLKYHADVLKTYTPGYTIVEWARNRRWKTSNYSPDIVPMLEKETKAQRKAFFEYRKAMIKNILQDIGAKFQDLHI